MSLTRDFKETVNERVKREPEFAKALLDEAISLFLNGEPETARLILRELVNATVGFEELAIETSKPSKSLHRMLSAKGNPTMDNLTSDIGGLIVKDRATQDLQNFGTQMNGVHPNERKFVVRASCSLIVHVSFPAHTTDRLFAKLGCSR